MGNDGCRFQKNIWHNKMYYFLFHYQIHQIVPDIYINLSLQLQDDILKFSWTDNQSIKHFLNLEICYLIGY